MPASLREVARRRPRAPRRRGSRPAPGPSREPRRRPASRPPPGGRGSSARRPATRPTSPGAQASSRTSSGPDPGSAATSARAASTASFVSSRRRSWTTSSSSASSSARIGSSSSSSVDRQLGVGDPTRGVDARHDAEGEVARGRLRRHVAAARQERAKPGVRGRGQLVEAEPDDRAALAGHRRQVGDRADGRHGRQARRPAAPCRVEQRRGELVRQPGAGEVRIGVGAVGPMRVDDRDGARQDRRRQVVVGDDDVEPERARRPRPRPTLQTPQSQVMTRVDAVARRGRAGPAPTGRSPRPGGTERSGSDRRRGAAGR